jgi:ParB/RepB/Spo0J family partition protein
MTKEELAKIEKEIALLEAEGKNISVSNKMKLKKLQRSRDKATSPIEPSSVFVASSTIYEEVRLINIDDIIMPDFNDRTGIDNKKIIELAESIKENGLIQPIILIEDNDGKYIKIAGRRRILATKLNGKTKIEAIIKKEKIDVKKMNLLVLHENTQREDLSSYDKVRSVLHFIEQEFSLDQVTAKKLCHKINNFNKGNLVNVDNDIEVMANTLNQILAETKVFSSVTHLIKHFPVLEMSMDILKLLETNKITFGMALIFNQYSGNQFKDNKTFFEIYKHIISEELSLKDAKAYFNAMLYKKEKSVEKDILRDIKVKLSKLNKMIPVLEEEKQKSFDKELNELIKKYK